MGRLTMIELPARDQITEKLKSIGHRTAFNNEQTPYRIVINFITGFYVVYITEDKLFPC